MKQKIEKRLPYLIAEIGINHNGDLDIAKKLINFAVEANFDAVKFQKKNYICLLSCLDLNLIKANIRK